MLAPSKRKQMPRIECLEDRCLLSAGYPDTSFGFRGIVETPFQAVDSSAFSILIQPDGRLVAVGAAGPNLALARYAPDGSLDPSFGQGGTVLTPVTAGFPDVSAGLDEKVSAVLENDGKILAVVPIGPNSFAQEALLVRYNSDGTLDTSFGSGGEIQLAIPNYTVIPADVTLQPDGKMVIAATVTLTTVPEFGLFEPTSEFGVIRLTAAGALDPSFGNGGIAIQGFPIPQNAAAEAIALQPDGRIVVAGEDLASFTESIAVLRFTSSGNLDNTWGQGGIVTANFGTAMNSAAGVAIQPDGKVVVAGTTNGIGSFDLNGDFGLLRFKSNGSPDLSFGDRGIVRVAFTPQQSRAEALTLQPDGGILVAGRTISNGRQLVALTRFETNGNLDPAFFGGGTVTTLIGNGAEALGIALQADGNIVVSGDVTDSPSSTTNFLLARYLGGPTTPAPVLTPNEMYVNQVYLDLLGRQADPAGLMSFSDQLDQGISRMRVALEIEGSLEYRTIEVENLYQKVLKRGADLPGLQYWVSYLVNGGIYNVAEAGFIASPEYAAHIPSGPQSQAGFVNAVYGTVLNRAPDPAGLQSWLGKLSHGASLAAVALAIIGSQEAALDLVESLYPTYLGRAADPAGLASFTNLLLFGAPPELVTAIILGSAEYFANLN